MQKKNVIIITLIIILFAVVILTVALYGKLFEKTHSAPQKETKEFTSLSSESAENNTVIFEENKITLSLKSIDESNVKFAINNQSDQSISASCHSIAVNKVMTQVFLVEDIAAGETKDVTIAWNEYAGNCGVQKKEDIKNITLDFNCTNTKDEPILSCNATTVDLGDVDYTYSPYDEVSQLYSEKDIIVSATAFKDNQENNAESFLIIQNNSELLVNAEILSILINNSDIDSFAFSEIYPGCIFYLPVIAENVTADSIKSFSLELNCSDSDYNEIFATTIEK